MGTDGSLLLPVWPLRWVGGLLVVVGLLLPVSLILYPDPGAGAGDRPAGGSVLRPEMIVLPAGSFMMGSPQDEAGRFDDETLHSVTLTSSFALARTEITQGQYFAVMGDRPVDRLGSDCETGDFDAGDLALELTGDDRSVVCVDWFEAIGYANRLSELEGLDPVYIIRGDQVTWGDGDGYRLPTEAEWEYAGRAGLETVYVGTNDPERVCRYGNVRDEAAFQRFGSELALDRSSFFPCDDGVAGLAPVTDDHLSDNPWRLRGMGGNAIEWVWDWYGPYELGRPDPKGADRGGGRVLRGGSWRYDPRIARVAYRYGDGPSYRIDVVGFRVARSLPSGFLPSGPLPAGGAP